jgi:hypothetical protein
MKLSVIRLGLTLAIIWALIALLCGIANLIWPEYGVSFLTFLDSIYPGYHFGQWGFGGILVATLYAAVDAFVVGAVFAWLYNLLGKCIKEEKK